MTIENINKDIEKKEGLKIEFKAAKDSVPASFYDTVSSFSNTDGGTIYLGITDDGVVEGINPASEVKLKKDIITALNSVDCINPPVYVSPFTVQHPGGLVMIIQIPASSQVHKYAGRIYSRDFESDIDVTDNQTRVSEIHLRKRTFFTESQIYPALSMDDLDSSLFQKARDIIRSNRGDHPWLLVSNEEMLKGSVLWRKDFLSGQEGLTLAAALIFGKDSTIQSLLPAYKVEAMVRIENVDRWDDRINPPLRTNLIDTYLQLKQFLNKHLPEKFYMEGDQRIDLRDKIFREIIGNVIVHREYTSALSTDLIITKAAVRITNPNKPHFHGPIDLNSFSPYPKNPNIRKFFTAFGWTDEIGSGIRNTNKYLPLYIPGAKPLFIENDTFQTEIPLKLASFGQFAKEFHKWLELAPETLPRLEKGLKEVVLPASLIDLEWKDLLLHLVPTWHQKGTHLPALDWPENQAFAIDEIKKVPTWDEKGTHLLRKKAWYLIGILSLATEPIKLGELLKIFDYKNEKSFRDNYLSPLRQVEFITLTNPGNLNDPDQKYKITEAGKLFLSGH
jgi:ATP-dependent DNA helicase RecG